MDWAMREPALVAPLASAGVYSHRSGRYGGERGNDNDDDVRYTRRNCRSRWTESVFKLEAGGLGVLSQ